MGTLFTGQSLDEALGASDIHSPRQAIMSAIIRIFRRPMRKTV